MIRIDVHKTDIRTLRRARKIKKIGKMMFRKQDKILIGAIAVTAAVSALLMVSVRQDSGAAVRITIDGALYGEYSLSEEIGRAHV